MIQTIDQLKTAFGDGKFPTLTNWEDLIDTIFSQGGFSRSQIHNIEMNAYEGRWDNYTIANEWMWIPSYGDNDNIGGARPFKDFDFLESNITSPYSPILASDFEKLFNRKTESVAYRSGDLTENEFKAHNHSYLTKGDILLIHNDGAFYYEYATDNGQIYIQWTAKGAGDYWNWYASDSRYYEFNGHIICKPQIIELPVGCTVAFAKTNGGWQPIGNFVAYDYNTLMQRVQNNPYPQY